MLIRTEGRIAKNNATFRDANERIRESAERHDALKRAVPFLCECVQEDCMEIVRIAG